MQLAQFRSLQQLPVEHQIIAALLRADVSGIESVLRNVRGNARAAVLSRLRSIVRHEGFAGRIMRLSANLPLDDLVQMASLEAATYQRMDEEFKRLVHRFERAHLPVVWLKGTSLSRTLYEVPYERASSDFDILARSADVAAVCGVLAEAGYDQILDSPAFCPQLGVGPIAPLEALLAQPSDEATACGVLAFNKQGSAIVEVKVDPLERGLKMKEAERFFRDTVTVQWDEVEFRAPSTIDHVLLLFAHLHKDGFAGWRNLLDLYVLLPELGKAERHELLRRIDVEAMHSSAFASLALLHDWLGLDAAAELLDAMRFPRDAWSKLLLYTVPVQFVWNSTNLFFLFLNAQVHGDSERKRAFLHKLKSPTDSFMRTYYGNSVFPPLLLHQLVLLLPAGVVRRTFGKMIKAWSPSAQGAHPVCHPTN